MGFVVRRSIALPLVQNVVYYLAVPTFINVSYSEFSPLQLDTHIHLRTPGNVTYFAWGVIPALTTNYTLLVRGAIPPGTAAIAKIPSDAFFCSILSDAASPAVVLDFGRDK